MADWFKGNDRGISDSIWASPSAYTHCPERDFLKKILKNLLCKYVHVNGFNSRSTIRWKKKKKKNWLWKCVHVNGFNSQSTTRWRLVQLRSVGLIPWPTGSSGAMRDDSADILCQSFQREATVSNSSVGRDVHKTPHENYTTLVKNTTESIRTHRAKEKVLSLHYRSFFPPDWFPGSSPTREKQ